MIVATRRFRAHVLRENGEVEVNVGPVWDSAMRYEIPLRLRLSRLDEEIDDVVEEFRELMLKVKAQLQEGC